MRPKVDAVSHNGEFLNFHNECKILCHIKQANTQKICNVIDRLISRQLG